MLHRTGQGYTWGILCVLLCAWALGTGAHAQFRSPDRPSRPDTLPSLAPAPLEEHRSLDRYVRDADGVQPIRPRPVRPNHYDPTLSRGQKLLWGTVGLVVQSFCDTDETNPLTARPASVLGPRERTCVYCDRLGDRAGDAVWEGLFSSRP